MGASEVTEGEMRSPWFFKRGVAQYKAAGEGLLWKDDSSSFLLITMASSIVHYKLDHRQNTVILVHVAS